MAHTATFGIHVTILVLLKGSYDSIGSRVLPDKAFLDFGYPCDGPGRGGTYDISLQDSFYLALFQILNSNSWIMFKTYQKHLLTAANLIDIYYKSTRKITLYEESSDSLNGWFKDYL